MFAKTSGHPGGPRQMGTNVGDVAVVVGTCAAPSATKSRHLGLPLKMLLYLTTLLLLLQPPKATLATRKLLSGESGNSEQYHNNNYRHFQESPGDTPDSVGSQESSESPYESTGSSELTEDRPPEPNELSVIRINDTSVVLRWEFPENSQEHLQFFKVQYKSTNRSENWKTDGQEIPTTTRAYQINGLRPGNFRFRVVALYDNDDNISSQPYKFKIRARSKIKAEEMPEMKPPHIYWTETATDYFRFKWKYDPKDSDTEDFGFLVFYRSAHVVSDFTIYNTMDTSVEIAEVESDTPYEAKVVAYNKVTVSEFSETIRIRTKPKQQNEYPNTTSSTSNENNNNAPLPAGPTQTPSVEETTTTNAPTTVITFTTPPILAATTRSPPSYPSMPTTYGSLPTNPAHKGNTTFLATTPKPSKPSTANSTTTDFYQSIISLFEPILTDQSDAMLIVRYLLLVFLPLLFIIIVLIFLIKPQKGKKKSPSESSSSNGSMQFDLEIDGYFKNSFPGVDKDYPGACIGAHNGFVNNHPQIDDSA